MMAQIIDCSGGKKIVKCEPKPDQRVASCSKRRFQRELRLMLLTLSMLLLMVSLAEAAGRTQYHEQGTHGPKSYKFGFSVHDHKNPQERHEVSDKKGHVKGWYSYKDPHGKMMVFHYEAHPKKGFKVKKYKKHSHKKHHG